MKVIDLLNKIANGENTPDKFIYDGMLFERHLDNYYQHYDIGKTCSNIVQFTDEICSDYSNLNDEIEIIEDTPKEDKRIEKFKVIKDNSGDSVELIYDGMKLELTLLQAIILDKLNKMIDKINEE